ncbi:MAG: hypothetical protein GX189_04510 [Clostridiales bacterium]|nr:hypothetical protein [Clostridiales bacterium]
MTKRRDREPEGGAWSPFKSREEAAMALYALLERCGLLDILKDQSGGALNMSAPPPGGGQRQE